MIKRWNRVFIHDKVMPEWIYRSINLIMCILDIFYWMLLSCARVKTNSRGGGQILLLYLRNTQR